MASEVGTRSVTTLDVAGGNQFVNNTNHTTTSDTDLLLCFIGWEGNEAPHATTSCVFDAGTSDVDLTLVRDTGSTGDNSDVRILVYGLVSPATITDAVVRTAYAGSGTPAVAIWVNLTDVNTTSVAAATNFISEDINTTGTTTSVMSSGGTSGNLLFAFGVAQGNDMNSSDADGSFTELVEGETAATTDDFAYNLSLLSSGLPSACTITWSATDENTGVLIEVVNAQANTGSLMRQRLYI